MEETLFLVAHSLVLIGEFAVENRRGVAVVFKISGVRIGSKIQPNHKKANLLASMLAPI